MSEKVAVIGMGYVGLPLALAMTAAGKEVTGIDTNGFRIAELSEGRSFTEDVKEAALKKAMNHGLSFSTDYRTISSCEVIVICVPTPLSPNNQEPDLESVLQAVRSVALRVTNRALVVIESTVSPGTTEGCILNEFSAAGKTLDEDFLLGFSPERVNPGPGGLRLEEIPKLTSGVSDASAARCYLFYSSFLNVAVRVNGTREAEFAKLLENSYRLVNIALVNELALAAFHMGIDFEEVVNAAATKPYGFQAFYSSAGAGGHCIPVDPVYLNSQILLETGSASAMLEVAIEKNNSMSEEILNLVKSVCPDLSGRKILVAGVSYKPGVSDVRNSPGIKVLQRLLEEGVDVSFYDPLVKEVALENTTLSSSFLDSAGPGFDVVLAIHPIGAEKQAAFRASGAVVVNLSNGIETR